MPMAITFVARWSSWTKVCDIIDSCDRIPFIMHLELFEGNPGTNNLFGTHIVHITNISCNPG